MSVLWLLQHEIALVEVLFDPQGRSDGLIDDRPRDEVIVVEIRERGVQTVDSAVRLPPIAVRVRLRVEANRVRIDAVPALCASAVLNQVQPALSCWNLLVFVAIPLRYRETSTNVRGRRAAILRAGS